MEILLIESQEDIRNAGIEVAAIEPQCPPMPEPEMEPDCECEDYEEPEPKERVLIPQQKSKRIIAFGIGGLFSNDFGGGTMEMPAAKMGWSFTALSFGLLGKYPIELASNISVFPAAGMGYRHVLSIKAGEADIADASDNDALWLKLSHGAGQNGFWWSATEMDAWLMGSGNGVEKRTFGSQAGLSVRCVKD